MRRIFLTPLNGQSDTETLPLSHLRAKRLRRGVIPGMGELIGIVLKGWMLKLYPPLSTVADGKQCMLCIESLSGWFALHCPQENKAVIG